MSKTNEQLENELEVLRKMVEDLKLQSQNPSLASQSSHSGQKRGNLFIPRSEMEEVIQRVTHPPQMASESDQTGTPHTEKTQMTLPNKFLNFEPPKFDGKNLEVFLDDLARFLRVSGLISASDIMKKDILVLMCCGDSKRLFKTSQKHPPLKKLLRK